MKVTEDMENYIEIRRDESVKIFMLRKTEENLKRYVPRGCPFEDYTMFDLLMDWISQYSWQIFDKQISLIDFVNVIFFDNMGDKKLQAYRNSMIELLER